MVETLWLHLVLWKKHILKPTLKIAITTSYSDKCHISDICLSSPSPIAEVSSTPSSTPVLMPTPSHSIGMCTGGEEERIVFVVNDMRLPFL